MTILNAYTTLSEFKAFITPPGQTLNVDALDDNEIERIIESASRRIDDVAGRVFYPHIDTYEYDIPSDNVIWFGDDLLEILSFKNGDLTTIASTEYFTKPNNAYPKYCLQMRDMSTTPFVMNSSSSSQLVLALNAIWGYHEWYALRGWKAAGTLGAAIADTTGLTFTMTAGHTLTQGGGQIVRIDNELFNTTSSGATSLVVQARGDNGSTAATHLILAPVYVWQHMPDISALALEIARMMYRSRYGENVETISTVTAGGVIVTPRSLPVWAQEIIRKYQRLV